MNQVGEYRIATTDRSVRGIVQYVVVVGFKAVIIIPKRFTLGPFKVGPFKGVNLP